MDIWVVYEIGEMIEDGGAFFIDAFPTQEMAEEYAEWYYNANGGELEWQKVELHQSVEECFEKFRKEIQESLHESGV